mmetsp:Transcript_13434/g.36767  ORF Transcript_13434/g.36767 Transcript_13434/m.36767 type:complete len:229 (+) Transcript_13434:324-1010(+)
MASASFEAVADFDFANSAESLAAFAAAFFSSITVAAAACFGATYPPAAFSLALASCFPSAGTAFSLRLDPMSCPVLRSAKPAAAPTMARTGSDPAATPAAEAAPAAASPPTATTPARSALVVGGCGGCDCCDCCDGMPATASATPILPTGRPDADLLGERLMRVDSEMTSSFSDASMPASSCDASSSMDRDLALRLSSLEESASTSSSTLPPSAPPDAARGLDATRLA